jgi:SPP1 family predicted phage head-tail adaptor
VQASKLDRRIRIEQPSVTRNNLGEAVATWSTLAEVWAQKINLTGRELYAAQQVVPEAQLKFRIRWRADIKPNRDEKMRIVDLRDAVTYGIQHIAEIGRQDGLEILVRSPE